MPLSSYTLFPTGGAAAITSADLSEVFLKSYNVAIGVSTITISDPSFKLATFKSIHVRFNNLTTTGATSSQLYGGPFKNDALVSGNYASTNDGISSATATGWASQSAAPANIAALATTFALSPSSQDFSAGIQQLDIYLTRAGMSAEFHFYNGTASRRYRATVAYPGAPTSVTSTDYFGVIIGLSAGSPTFTGGTVSVYGVQ